MFTFFAGNVYFDEIVTLLPSCIKHLSFQVHGQHVHVGRLQHIKPSGPRHSLALQDAAGDYDTQTL